MASYHYRLLSDEDLIAKQKRLLEQLETPVNSTGGGSSQVTLQQRDIGKQLDDVMMEMHRRGIVDLSDAFQKRTPVHFKDRRYCEHYAVDGA